MFVTHASNVKLRRFKEILYLPRKKRICVIDSGLSFVILVLTYFWMLEATPRSKILGNFLILLTMMP